MKQPKKVLACVDQSPYADCVADYSAWVAQKFNLPLELLHIIDRHQEPATSDDHSGAIGFDAQENLLNQLAAASWLSRFSWASKPIAPLWSSLVAGS